MWYPLVSRANVLLLSATGGHALDKKTYFFKKRPIRLPCAMYCMTTDRQNSILYHAHCDTKTSLLGKNPPPYCTCMLHIAHATLHNNGSSGSRDSSPAPAPCLAPRLETGPAVFQRILCHNYILPEAAGLCSTKRAPAPVPAGGRIPPSGHCRASPGGKTKRPRIVVIRSRLKRAREPLRSGTWAPPRPGCPLDCRPNRRRPHAAI